MPCPLRWPFQHKQPIHWGYHLVASVICSIASPTWWWLKTAFKPYLRLDELVTSLKSSAGISPQMFLSWPHQLNPFGSEGAPIDHILPLLFLGLLLNLLYYWAWIGLLSQVGSLLHLARQALN